MELDAGAPLFGSDIPSADEQTPAKVAAILRTQSKNSLSPDEMIRDMLAQLGTGFLLSSKVETVSQYILSLRMAGQGELPLVPMKLTCLLPNSRGQLKEKQEYWVIGSPDVEGVALIRRLCSATVKAFTPEQLQFLSREALMEFYTRSIQPKRTLKKSRAGQRKERISE